MENVLFPTAISLFVDSYQGVAPKGIKERNVERIFNRPSPVFYLTIFLVYRPSGFHFFKDMGDRLPGDALSGVNWDNASHKLEKKERISFHLKQVLNENDLQT